MQLNKKYSSVWPVLFDCQDVSCCKPKLLNSQRRIMQFWLSDWFTGSRLPVYLRLTLYGNECDLPLGIKISRDSQVSLTIKWTKKADLVSYLQPKYKVVIPLQTASTLIFTFSIIVVVISYFEQEQVQILKDWRISGQCPSDSNIGRQSSGWDYLTGRYLLSFS